MRVQPLKWGLCFHTYRWSLTIALTRKGRRPTLWVDLFDLYNA